MTVTDAKKKVVSIALSNLGYHEVGNNQTKFAEGSWDNVFYGWELNGQPWCDVFVDYCFVQAFGMERAKKMTYQTAGGSALCRTSAQYFKDNGAFSSTPQMGDQVFFYSGGAINHTGLVERVNTSAGTWSSFVAIEGNSSDSVARRTYNRGNSAVAGFGHPKWSVVTGAQVDTDVKEEEEEVIAPQEILRYGQSSEAVKKLQENLIKLGYDLGAWGADGDFGKATVKAVKQFQKDNGLDADGEAGPLTLAAIEKKLTSSAKVEINEEADTPSAAEPTEKTYTVKKGDTLWGIAASQLGRGFRYREIKKLNGLKTNIIKEGQVLKLP